MTKIQRAYKYRLYPNKTQRIELDQNFGAVRFLWNALVDNFNNYGTPEHVKNLSEIHIKQNNPWMHDRISYALQQKRRDFFEATKQYFNKKRKKKSGRPKFKKRGVCNDSFRFPAKSIEYLKGFDFENRTIKIPKIGKIKVRYDRSFSGHPLSVTISKTKSNEYYISVVVEEERPKSLSSTYNDVGLDIGLDHLIVTSEGDKTPNPRYFRKTQTKLRKAQKALSRKIKGSKNWQQARHKVARLHQKVTRQRKWLFHQIVNGLITSYDSIIIEDLNVQGMMKNRRLSKSIADASWSTFVGILSYKANWYGKEVLKINRFFPSSKKCHCCGFKVKDMSLSIREWKCPSCDIVHDRDINAAKNIMKEGLMVYHGVIENSGGTARSLNGCGENIRPRCDESHQGSLNEAII